jgi:hypothetical protein
VKRDNADQFYRHADLCAGQDKRYSRYDFKPQA